MKKPTRADFGWTRQHGWKCVEDIDRWSDALCIWENTPRSTGGRQRTRPIHPSWESVLKYFDSTNPQCSQGAFCRYVNQEPATKGYWKNGLTPAMLSAAKTKQITEQMYAWIHRFAYDSTKEVENG